MTEADNLYYVRVRWVQACDWGLWEWQVYSPSTSPVIHPLVDEGMSYFKFWAKYRASRAVSRARAGKLSKTATDREWYQL